MSDELRMCSKDGPYRGKTCPVCGEHGKLLIREEEVEGIGRILAGMLRHFPDNYGVRLNEHGWVKIYNVIPIIRAQRRNYWWVTPSHIKYIVETDPKQRYQINSKDEIRAAYGHTIPINMDDLPRDGIPEVLYYQTTEDELPFILESGISPSDKTWVHLSLTERQAYVSGMFHVQDPLVVEIDAKGLEESGQPVYRATSEVFLTAGIPPEFIKKKLTEKFELTEEEKADLQQVKERAERRAKRMARDNQENSV